MINQGKLYCRSRRKEIEFMKGKHRSNQIGSGKKVLHLFIAIALLSALHLFSGTSTSAADKYQKMINCDPNKSACKQQLEDITVVLDINPKPVKAMQELVFQVTLEGNNPRISSAPAIDLGMPGMDMGPNHVALKSIDNGKYRGKGIIVRCPSGRTIWQATVTVPDIGKVKFIFDVIY